MHRSDTLLVLLFTLFGSVTVAQPFSPSEITRWQKQSRNITIIRDNWGIPHIYGKTDADAVFGLLYAQCEDDFKRVELNYIEKLGRKSEIFGEKELQNDLYVRLIIDSADAVADYNKAPGWLKKLLDAYAGGINYFIYKNRSIKPLLLHRFKPWYPLLWTDGSIGAISTGDIKAEDVKKMYGSNIPLFITASVHKEKDMGPLIAPAFSEDEKPDGSNGFAIAPSRTENGNAILYINPHTTFYFRPEVQVCSQQGLNVYGAVTWGQFFIYQGFNQNCGWMHTSSNVDVSDMYSEEIIKKGKGFVYKYDNKWFPVKEKKILLKIKTELGFKDSSIIAYFTHHGPVMAFRNNQFISVRSNNRNINGLIQSWQRTKAGGLEDYKKAMHIRANTSNNTVFADKKGNIAYWHGNFIPIRDKKYNWGKVVDGTTSATEWKGIHSVEEGVHVYNPANGWIQNCNSTPFSVCGSNSPKRENYPVYMAPDGENFRAINAVKVLGSENKFNIDKIIAAGYNRYLSAFGILIPALINRFEKNLVSAEPFFKQLEEPIAILKSWDYNADEQSIAQTLAIGWAEKLNPAIKKVYVDEGEPDQVAVTKHFAATATKEQLLLPLLEVVNDLQKKFGTWKMEWGEINRYQRVGNEVDQKYDDARESFPVPFASSLWGMLPAYNSNYFPGTDKRYGVSGNSFICAVEFGKRIRARSLLAGGESSNINSPHFTDQLLMYTKGMFKEVLFYKEEVLKHAEKTYHPGKQGR